MRKWCNITCLQEFIDTATRWILRMVATGQGYKEAEVAKVKSSQNLPLHRRTALTPYKIRQR